MEKNAPKDRSKENNEPLHDEELEKVSGGTASGIDWVASPNGFPERRRRPQPPGPLSGMIGEITGS